MIPLGKFGGYQETTRESLVTSDSIGQSGGEAAECEMEGERVEGNEMIEHSNGIQQEIASASAHTAVPTYVYTPHHEPFACSHTTCIQASSIHTYCMVHMSLTHCR